MLNMRRRLPPQWVVEDIGGYFVVKARNDEPLLFITEKVPVVDPSPGYYPAMWHDEWRRAALSCQTRCSACQGVPIRWLLTVLEASKRFPQWMPL